MLNIEPLNYSRGRGLKLTPEITIKHPKVSEIEEMCYDKGSNYYLDMVTLLISNPRDFADILWFENNVWYEDIGSDWDFFVQTALSVAQEKVFSLSTGAKITTLVVSDATKDALNYFLQLNGDYTFIQEKIENSDKVQTYLLYIDNTGVIDEDAFKLTEFYYSELVEYLCDINHLHPVYDFSQGGNKNSKIYILKHKYKQRQKPMKKPTVDFNSMLSSLVAKGCSYSEVWEYPVYFFYQQYTRHIKIVEYSNTMQAFLNDRIDTSKNPIEWAKVDWSSIIQNKQ